MKTKIITIEKVEDTGKFLQIVKDEKGSSAFKRILQLIQMHGIKIKQEQEKNEGKKRLKDAKESCITILKTNEYKDTDWEDEFKEISKIKNAEYTYLIEDSWISSFKDIVRFDFFSTKINKKNSVNLKKFAKEYLGYCILRPLYLYHKKNERKVLKAIIKPLPQEETYIESTKLFDTEVKIKSNNNIIKETLKIGGFPFQQQDGYIGRCAHASISISEWYMNPKQGLRKLSKFLKSYKNYGFSSPSFYRDIYQESSRGGLTTNEIVKIASEFSTPLPYNYPMEEEGTIAKTPERAIYWYIESGFPVIITGLGIQHAVVVIGHDFNPSRWWEIAKKAYYEIPLFYHSSADWVENFIIQDDNFGPYLYFPVRRLEWILREKKGSIDIIPLLPKIKKSEFLKTESLSLTQKEIENQLEEKKEKCKEKIDYTKGENAEEYSYSLLEKIVPVLAKKTRIINLEKQSRNTFDLFLQHFDKRELLHRTYLIDKKTFITSLSKRGISNTQITLGAETLSLIKYYEKKIEKLPPLFWVSEISIPELYCHQNQCLGEILISPLKFSIYKEKEEKENIYKENEEKEKKRKVIIPCFSIHIPGILCDYLTPFTNPLISRQFKGDKPYRIFLGTLRNLIQ